MKISKWILGIFLLMAGLIPSMTASAVTIGQADNFQDGTTQNWVVGLRGAVPAVPPANVATGGPAGDGDHYLLLTSIASPFADPGNRLVVINLSQWTGNYLGGAVNFITMDVKNPSATDLQLRIRVADPNAPPTNTPTHIAVSTDAVFVPAGSGWTRVVFPMNPDQFTALKGDAGAALGNVADLRIFHNPAPTFPPPTIDAQLGVDNITARKTLRVSADFNGDGKSDILWRNTATGEGSLWLMNGDSIIGGGPLSTVPLAWTIAGRGDFDNDGKDDILWRNTATGEGSLWLMNGASIIGGGPLPTVPLDWTIAGRGDFDNDGKDDILWRNTATGEGSLWLMNGASIIGGGPLSTVPLAWTIAGTGDFDNDGKDDILWRNTATGEGSLWLMNGASVIGGGPLPTVPLDWTIAGTGDFDNDGKDDILWRNTATGEGSLWLMNGASIIGGGPLPTVPLAWTIAGTGDFNSDGKDDILWRNTATGEGSLWLMNGASFIGGGPLPTIPLAWMIK